MNLINKLRYLPFFLLPFLFACNEEETDSKELENNFTISGKITGAKNLNIYVEAASQNGIIDVASSETDTDGSFEIKGNIPDMGIYQLRLGDGDDKIIPMTLMPKDHVKINSDINSYTVSPKYSGTEWAEPLTRYMQMANNLASQDTEFAKLQTNGASEEELRAAYDKMLVPLNEFAIAQMIKMPSNPVNIIFSRALTPKGSFDDWDPKNLDVLKKVCQAYTQRFKDSPIVKTLENQVFQIESAYNEHLNGTDTDVSVVSAQMAPEISMKNPEGKVINLSDFRGKYVLIDFWAAWCGPCRRENPTVVKLYNKYKNKDFTILSVSLDKDAYAWKQAILADGLVWPNHVSELNGWETSVINTYNFNSIPHTVLVDKTGKIIATKLSGESLEQKLKELL